MAADYGRPRGYDPLDTEDPRIDELRRVHAARQRAWVAAWVDDPHVSDIEFAYTLHKITFEDARDMCQLSLDIMDREGREGPR